MWAINKVAKQDDTTFTVIKTVEQEISSKSLEGALIFCTLCKNTKC